MTATWTSADGTVTLYLADCLDILPTLTAGSVDAIVTDPPYGVNLSKHTCGWDEWPGLNVWHEIGKTVRQDGLLALTMAPHVAHERIPDVVSIGWSVLEVGFWVWGNGRPVRHDRLKRCYDLIYFMSQKSRSLHVGQARGQNRGGTASNRDGCVRASRFDRGLGRQFNDCKPGSWYSGNYYHPANVACTVDDETLGRYSQIFAVKRLLPINHCDEKHPTEKPLDLVAQIVNLVSKPQQLVLDPFMGSGTTGVACAHTGRKFIGLEVNQAYWELACNRIEKALAQPRLPLLTPPREYQMALELAI